MNQLKIIRFHQCNTVLIKKQIFEYWIIIRMIHSFVYIMPSSSVVFWMMFIFWCFRLIFFCFCPVSQAGFQGPFLSSCHNNKSSFSPFLFLLSCSFFGFNQSSLDLQSMDQTDVQALFFRVTNQFKSATDEAH